jgi:hypothetical protein
VNEADEANLKGVEELGAPTPAPQLAAPPCTRTRTVTFGIPDPVVIAEVDGFGRYLETPQHDNV